MRFAAAGEGGLIGGAAGAGIGALIYHSNPWAGALIGAAGHTGEKERDGRVDLILNPVVQQ